MSETTIVSSGKKSYIASAAMSFVGMLAAVPVVMVLFSPNAPAGAAPNNTSDYDKFAYAYSQGYLANAANANTESMDSCGLPVGGMGSVGGAEGWGAVAATDGAVAVAGSTHTAIRPAHRPVGGSGNVVLPAEMAEVIRESYNTYHHVENTTYTNSNNSIGSNNSTSTSVAVSDSRNVHIDTENTTDIDNDVENTAVSDSFNNDSHDTTTTNTAIAIDDSLNENSGNTENTTVSNTEETNTTNTTTTVVTNTENSNNTTTLEGFPVPLILNEL